MRRPDHTLRQSFFDTRGLREWPYLFLCTGLFFAELGYWIPSFLISLYAQLSLGTTPDYAFYLVAFMNAGGLAGRRILPAYLAQIVTIGPAWVLAAGAGLLAWLSVQTVAGITALCIFLGFMSGIVVSVPNVMIPELSPSMSVVGARSGMMWTFVAFAGLIGAPLAGLLVNTRTNNYAHGLVFSGVSMCVGSAMLCLLVVHITRSKLTSGR
ncbi:hypothetical protein LTR56_023564 [Elasticomyces elasticus]|nr:hypothetical protein LTR56_023564 [Elasticomyces elasticus]KAK3624232.1 hypothetical protein LTR22_024060 [Elasticomyces elasticus]KAK4906086.1 hypothetical protein LTR49_024714 [Elasticomyces elasticus]KAK5744110.1 hypothetical protein LTS12_023586 [Elasticomyces elasticus]